MSQQANSLTTTKSSLIHQPFPDHEVNLFNPPKRNPNGYLSPARLYLNDLLEEKLIPSKEEKTQVQKILLNPWTISSVVVLLLANLISGAVVLLHRQEATEVTKESSAQQILTGPNLAAKEFIDLNLNTLSTISSSEAKNIKAAPAKSITEIYPGYIPTYAAHPLLATNKNYFYILTEYAGDRSLELAKAQVQQVSLVHFPQGIFIYMGAFKQRSQAEKFVASLREEGMYTYIYPFE